MKTRFEKKLIPCSWKGPFGDTRITIETPNLTNKTPYVWGDWGPNYEFQLDAADPIKLHYHGKESGRITSLEKNTIAFHSPMIATEREKYPLYFKIEDPETNLHFEIKLKESGDIGDVCVDYVPASEAV